MQTLTNMGQIRSKPVRDVRLPSLYAIVGQYWTNIGQYICLTGVCIYGIKKINIQIKFEMSGRSGYDWKEIYY